MWRGVNEQGIKMSNEHYLEGVRAAQGYYGSHCHGFSMNIKAEDAIRIYWPPVEEQMVQYQSPLPKPRKDWIRGFKEEQAVILAELENNTCPDVPIT